MKFVPQIDVENSPFFSPIITDEVRLLRSTTRGRSFSINVLRVFSLVNVDK